MKIKKVILFSIFISLIMLVLLKINDYYSFFNNLSPSETNIENNTQIDHLEDDISNSSLIKDGETIYFNISDVPIFDDSPFVVINNNIPYFNDEEKENYTAFEYYSPLDDLGRCGVAYANLCKELMPTEERGEIGMIKPSGWHTVKYNGIIDGNYLYNRCHLIGYQLAGENANELNLITGTRYLNVVGMLPFENEIANYINATNNHVLYRVTPIFVDDNLVASGVLIEAWSTEDNGEGICFNVYCYNIQPQIIIDYKTGDSFLEEGGIDSSENSKDEFTRETCDYVLNTNSKKIHLPSCSSVDDMAEHNKRYYVGSIEELLEDNFSPCQRCLADYSN